VFRLTAQFQLIFLVSDEHVDAVYWNSGLELRKLKRGLAPVGWHVPSDVDWIILSTYLEGEEVA
jgi:hypothetical protein